MYIRFNAQNKKVVYVGEEKPINKENETYIVAECDNIPPKSNNQYYTVVNVEEKTRVIKEAWDEPIEEYDENGELKTDLEVKHHEAITETYLTCDLVVKDRPQPSEEALLLHKLSKLREKRKPLLEAFDKWEKAVLRGREQDSQEIMSWYKDLLDLKEFAFKNIPERVNYFIN